jgi:uncharacterized repeat protein (TIGR01451 family)
MTFTHWLRTLPSSRNRTIRSSEKAARRRHTQRPGLEKLEDRLAPATTPTFANDNWRFLTDNDASGSLTVGDTLDNANDTINPGGVVVTYGVDGFGTVTTGAFTGSVAGAATINDAIANTTVGGTVNVLEGTYGERVTANQTVSLRGAQAGVDARTRSGVPESVIRGADVGAEGRSTSFHVTANDVVIDGFTVQENSSSNTFGAGILLSAGTNGSEVRNNVIQDNIIGLFLTNNSAVNQTVIERNLFRDNDRVGPAGGNGIYTDEFVAGGAVSNVLIDNNTFAGHRGHGITFSSTTAASPATNITVSNNLFDANDRALSAFNLTASQISGNTMQNSTGPTAADIRLFEGVSGVTITRNVLQNGAGRAVRVTSAGTGLPDAANVTFQLNSISGYTGPVGTFQVDAGSYAGALDATCNWWGDITGPTIASNPGGAGQTLADPDGVVDYQPWLVYAPDGDAATPGVQLVASFTVPAQTAGFTTTNNNYRRLVNVIDCLQPGQTAILSGTFDWTEANAAASWALGNDGLNGTSDDFSLAVRPNLNNAAVSAAGLGSTRIQGPGDLAARNLEGVFNFAGGDNQNWTISNLEIFDFDLAIGMFSGAGGADAYNSTRILNNHIRIPADLNATVAPADVNQNIGIHFSFGQNQTIQNNVLDIAGNGVSDGANRSASMGMQSNTSGGNVYDGLVIDNNTINITSAQAADPATIIGIWENGHAHSSDITVSNNDFVNLAAGNNAAVNVQRAFRVTSHSSAASAVTYTGNTIGAANIGFEWLAGSSFAGNQAVRLWQNTLAGTNTGVLLQSNGIANLFQNTISGSLSAGVNVDSGNLTGSGPVTNGVQENFITGGAVDGIRVALGNTVTGAIFNNDLSGNTGLGVNNLSAVLVDASGNWWGTNTPAGVAAEVSANVDYTPWLDTGADTSAAPGFQGNFATLHVDDTSPQAGATGRIQEGVNLASGATPTVIIEAGTYAENVAANKAGLTLDGATGVPTDVVIAAPGTNGITVTADNVTIRDLRVTGAANALVAANLSTLSLANLQLDGNASGGTLANITTVNFTASPAADTVSVDGSQFSATNVQAVSLSGVSNFNAFGDGGSDTFNVTPASAMTINIDGDLPTPPATPGDTLNVNTAGTTSPTLTSTGTPSGLQGSYTFGNRQPVNFQEIETLGTMADLSVTKDDVADPVNAGSNVTYTITVTNGGAVDAQNVALSDLVPTNTTFVSFTAPAGWATTTPPVGGTGTVSANNPTLAAGSGPQIFTLVVNVNANTADGSTITNTVTVNTTTAESNAANNSDTETTSVQTSADVSVTKTDSPDPVTAGENLSYVITVSNAGPSDAQNVALSDVVPANTTFVSMSQTSGPAFTISTPPAGGTGTVTANIDTLAAGATATFTLVVNVNASTPDGSTISNTVTVSSATTDSNPADNADTETTAVNAVADVSIIKTDSPDPVNAGSNITYTITLTNAGPSDAQNLALSDLVPANTTFVSFTAPAGWATTTPPAGGTGPVTATSPTLAAGASPVFTLVVKVDATAVNGSTITNTVTAASTTTDPDAANNADTETTLVGTAAGLSVTKSDSPDPVVAGQNITYTIIVTNAGPSDALGVTLTDVVPANTTFVSFTSPAGWTSTTPPVGGTGPVSAAAPTLAAGASATFTLVVRVNPAAANNTLIVNSATVAGATVDPNPADNTATSTTTVRHVQYIAVGAALGRAPSVAVYDQDGTEVASFLAFGPTFRGGVRVAVGDVNGDGTADIIVASGPHAAPRVKVVDGTRLAGLSADEQVPGSALLGNFLAFHDGFSGGVFVAAGDINGDGRADIIASKGPGEPRVKVIDATRLGLREPSGRIAPAALLGNYLAFQASFHGGVTSAAGDVNGDGRADVIHGPASGVRRVKVFNGTQLNVLREDGRPALTSVLANFYAYQADFSGGVFVAADRVNADLNADIITAQGPGGEPRVKVIDGTRANQRESDGRISPSALLAREILFEESYRGGTQVGAIDLDNDGLAEILAGFGPTRRRVLGLDVLANALELSFDTEFAANSLAGR